MEPIATYAERLLEVRRDFSLHADRVEIDARWLFRGRFRTTVALSTLQRGEPRRFFVRYRINYWAGWVMAVALLVFAFLFYRAQGGPIGLAGALLLAVAVAAALVLAITYRNRRIPFVRFDAKSGRGGLDIGQAGNDAATFAAFVDKVRRQIARG